MNKMSKSKLHGRKAYNAEGANIFGDIFRGVKKGVTGLKKLGLARKAVGLIDNPIINPIYKDISAGIPQLG